MSSSSSYASGLGETRVTAGGDSRVVANTAGAAFSPGERIGRYLVVEEIGRGGMGVVLRAYDPRLNREVALKSVHAEMLDADAQLRMLREAQAMAKLSHPNVVPVYDVMSAGAAEDRRVVLAMEGREHPLVAEAHVALARVLNAQRRHEDAVVQLDRAVRLQEKLLGPDHPRLAMGRHNLGVLLIALGRHDEAERELSAAVRQQAQTLGLDHPDTIIFRSNLGLALKGQGRYEEAAQELRAVLAAWGDAPGPRRDVVLAAREGLGVALLELGHPREATPLLEQVWAEIGDDEGVWLWLRAETAFTLARALWRTSAQRARARGLAERARALYGKAQREVMSRQVEAWLSRPF